MSQENEIEAEKLSPTIDFLPSDETPCCVSRFFRMQLVKFPIGGGAYQQCTFIGVDSHGVATVKTQGGRYRTVWDCNLYSVHNANVDLPDTAAQDSASKSNSPAVSG
jgi:hypothetical protein